VTPFSIVGSYELDVSFDDGLTQRVNLSEMLEGKLRASRLTEARCNECLSTFSLNEPTRGCYPENGAQANHLSTGRATFSPPPPSYGVTSP
jgi:hypothetical protein